MAETFALGEIALAISTEPAWNGAEVEIVGLPQSVGCFVPDRSGFVPPGFYLVAHNGHTYKIEPERLRKKRPPPQREELGDWELCPWRPERITADQPTDD